MKTQINILSHLRIAQAPSKATASAIVTPQKDGLQPDLLYMDSVLVSTGQNENDDVFLPSEMWLARSSPILKPVDWEHNTGKEIVGQPGSETASTKSIVEDNQIIGVMYNSFVALKDGTIISEEQAQADEFIVPEEFDIINQAVIYKYLYPRAAARIVRDASSGGLFVSMEAWFNDYDYKVGTKIVARNEETAFLDRHLRANGGNGLFGDVNVGRVLRNLVFGGVGIVANPANKDSVIHSFTNANLEQNEIVHSAVASNIIGEIPGALSSKNSQEVIEIMSENKTENAPAVASISHDDYKGVVDRLVRAEHKIEQKDVAIASTQAETEKLKASVESLTSAFVKGGKALSDVLGIEAAQKLQGTDASEFFSVLAEVVSDKLKNSAELLVELTEAKKLVAELEVEKRSITRSTEIDKVLSEFVKDEDKKKKRKDKMAEATKHLDDETFAAYLEDTKELLVAAFPDFLKKKKDKDGDDEDEDKKKKKKDAKASDEGITDPAILANVKATASVSAGNEVVPADDGSNKWDSLAKDLLSATKRNPRK